MNSPVRFLIRAYPDVWPGGYNNEVFACQKVGHLIEAMVH